MNIGSAISIKLCNRVDPRNRSCRLGGQMSTSVKALQAGTTKLIERVFNLSGFIIIGYTQVVAAWRDMTTQRVVLHSTTLKFVGTLLITEQWNIKSLERFSSLFEEQSVATLLVNKSGRLASRIHSRHESRFTYDTSKFTLWLFIGPGRYNFEVEHKIVYDFTDDVSSLNVGLLEVSMAIFEWFQSARNILHKNQVFHVLLSLKSLGFLNLSFQSQLKLPRILVFAVNHVFDRLELGESLVLEFLGFFTHEYLALNDFLVYDGLHLCLDQVDHLSIRITHVSLHIYFDNSALQILVGLVADTVPSFKFLLNCFDCVLVFFG